MLPATFTTLIVCAFLIIIGVAIVGAAARGPRQTCSHPDCRRQNPISARYCAQCGRPLADAAPPHAAAPSHADAPPAAQRERAPQPRPPRDPDES